MRKTTFLLIILITLSILHYPQIGLGNNYIPFSAANVASSTPIPELSWTSGHLFPLINGSPVFPTLNPSATPSVDQTHWYAGGIYPNNAPAQNARTIYMSIEVPPSAPMSNRFYYVLLSAWDNAGSYDQIGFSDSYGVWGLTYSWTSGSPNNPTYHYSANAMALSSGVTYTFNITVESGVAHFVVYQGSAKVWYLDEPTGGDYLVISSNYSGFGADYTNYEEVYPTSTPGNDPEFDFHFYNNYWISTDGYSNPTTWATFSAGAPSNVAVIISGNSVFVSNPSPSSISCSVSPNSIAIGSSVNVSESISPFLSGVAVNLSYTLPNSSVLIRIVTSAADGSYADRYAPTMLGSWRVKASWNGDTTYDGATSPTLSFTVHHSNALKVPQDYSTIQAALNAAFVGDTISVASGTYNENPEVGISNVTLTGQDSSTTVVNGTFVCQASNVRIVNFEIRGEFDLYFDTTYVYVSRNILRAGIRITACTSTVINNIIYGNVTIFGQQGAASGNIIENNTLYGGIILQCPSSGIGNNVNYNVITKNSIINASVGIWEKGNVHATDIYPDCYSNNISENWLNKCGVGVELSKNIISPSFSIVSRNTFESCDYGVVLDKVTNVSVYQNSFIDNTVQASVDPVINNFGTMATPAEATTGATIVARTSIMDQTRTLLEATA